MLKIKQAELAASAVMPAQYPAEALPEIALIGRSNAGKSSLINTLIKRKNLARTSQAPGKTRLLNFYRIAAVDENGLALPFFFVDLPGYGYAKAAKTERGQWLNRIERLLTEHTARLACWQLVDIRHKPSVEDIAMHKALSEAGFALCVIANKADKISKNARAKQLKIIAGALNIKTEQIRIFSAVSREGSDELLDMAEAHARRYWINASTASIEL
ncbi:MAG: ribosome biogenesis GTP-binding protein YihA/YsxC [Clostridiales bacterium]|nr:ribosome biogenesis GTP-binding protein YihA/YsxC [Clostridiales bacterium]